VPGPPLAILRTGLMTSVGLSAPAACAAIRASLTNHTETRFVNRAGERIMAAQVPLEDSWRGANKLARMVAPAIAECLDGIPPSELRSLPLLLCVAEREREGRFDEIDSQLIGEVSRTLDVEFDARLSAVIAYGRVAVPVALSQARRLVQDQRATRVVVAAVDSLLVGATLSAIEEQGRLLAPDNSNGFIPGEAAGALLLGADPQHEPRLFCTGVGFAEETATIALEEPLRATGLTAAVKQALGDANCDLNDLDFRITDNSGEQYYFKEAALTYSRIARFRKEAFEMWHPADCIGETGAAIGTVALAVADAACRKKYARGPGILFHCGNDAGQRAAVVLRWGAPQ
jgi:3-oxoacyl-[acyl-carrier-protein] synthase I